MPIVNPDTSSVQTITPGTYPSRITSVLLDTSQKGEQMLRLTHEINANGDLKSVGDIVMLEGRGVFSLINLLRAIGEEDMANDYVNPEVENPGLDTDVFMNAELQAVVDTQMYNGTPRDNVASYLKA